jgi:hypothetical protein
MKVKGRECLGVKGRHSKTTKLHFHFENRIPNLWGHDLEMQTLSKSKDFNSLEMHYNLKSPNENYFEKHFNHQDLNSKR